MSGAVYQPTTVTYESNGAQERWQDRPISYLASTVSQTARRPCGLNCLPSRNILPIVLISSCVACFSLGLVMLIHGALGYSETPENKEDVYLVITIFGAIFFALSILLFGGGAGVGAHVSVSSGEGAGSTAPSPASSPAFPPSSSSPPTDTCATTSPSSPPPTDTCAPTPAPHRGDEDGKNAGEDAGDGAPSATDRHVFFLRLTRRMCWRNVKDHMGTSGGQALTVNPSTDLLVAAQYAPVSEVAYQPAQQEDTEQSKLMPQEQKELSNEDTDRMVESDPRIVLRPLNTPAHEET